MVKNKLNINMKKLTAVLLTGTMAISTLAGCGKKEDATTEIDYSQVLSEKIDDYLTLSREYNKAKEMYEVYPTVETLEALKDATVALNEIAIDELSKKLGFDFTCAVIDRENGDTKYIIQDEKDSDIVYTHFVTLEGENYGEISSEIVLKATKLVFDIPTKPMAKWSEEDKVKFLEVADAIDETAKQIVLTDFEITDGNIIEVKKDTKEYTK